MSTITQTPRGPGKLTFAGIDFVSQGGLTLDLPRNMQEIATDQFGPMTAGHIGPVVAKISLKPIASWATLMPLFQLVQALALGQCIAPKRLGPATIDTGTEILSGLTAHGLTTADAVRVATDGILPALSSGSLSPGTTYYARAASADTITLHASANDATNNASPINFSGTGTGNFYITRDVPAVVHFASGEKFSFINVGITKLPTIVCTAGKLVFDGNLELECYVGTATAATAAGALYTKTRAAYTAPTPPGTTKLTLPVSVAWGATAPWDSFTSEEGFAIAVEQTLKDIPSDAVGIASKYFTGAKVTVKAMVQGITRDAVEAKLTLQDTAGGVGQAITGTDLVLSGTGFVFTVPAAMLGDAQFKGSMDANGIAELTWTRSQGTSGSTGWFTAADE